ncbi:MAG: polysaccharide deacetylase family protein [Vicinamibacterales bacterium]
MSGTCLVVMYHYLRDSASTEYPGIRSLPPALFEQQLGWLERKYDVIDLARLEAAIDGRAALPGRAALLTFDDGFVDHYEVAFPALRRHGLTGVFFLAENACGATPRVLGVHKTHFLLARLGADGFARAVLDECAAVPGCAHATVFGADRWEHAGERAVKDLLNYDLPFEDAERVLDALFARHIGPEDLFARRLYLSHSMIAEMAAAGMVFGHHTRSHRMLSRLTVAEQEQELGGGVAWIRARTGQARVPFCYPWGGPETYTRDTLRILGAAGYSLAFNTVRRRVNLAMDGRFELPRVDTRDLPPYTAGEPEAMAAAAPAEEA